MLTNLSIRNIVLIDKLDLNFKSGLTVFTGETGAGKSILLDSLSLTLGARADLGLIRHGETTASVCASFTLPLIHSVAQVLTSHGYPFDGEIILRRTLSANGASRAFLNDEPISLSLLKEIGDNLVEIHGQFASHKLLNPATHLDTLDSYGGLGDLVADCRRAHSQWAYKKRQRNESEQSFMRAKEEEDYLRTSVADLERLNPTPDEEAELTQKRTALMNSEKIITALNESYSLLADEQTGAGRPLNDALSLIERANTLSDNGLSETADALSGLIAQLDDITARLEKQMDSWGDTADLPAIDDRLFALRDMARKHHVAISELPALYTQLQDRLNQIELGEEGIIALKKQEEEARLAYITAAEKLSTARHQAAKTLDEAVRLELPALKLGKAVFKTDIQKLPEENWSEAGTDKVVFLVSTNAGTPLSPIHKIASGGELARFMLALKVNLATTEEVETLIFDEVDTGIGGATAASVGSRLKRLADTNQVLVITHSPQVASYGQTHLKVQKTDTTETVLTTVSELSPADRINEIARMLSGEHITQTAQTMARELLSSCK